MMSKNYQKVLIILFALSWGLVFLDRQAISYVFPILMKEFNLNNAQVGSITMWSAIAFAVVGFSVAIVADRVGYRKKFLIPFLICGALASALTAVAATIFALMMIRLLVGIFEGPVYSLQTTILNLQVDKDKFAKYIGYQALGAALLTGILGPIVVTQLATRFSWQYALILTSLPALIIAIIIAFYVKEVDTEKLKAEREMKAEQKASLQSLIELFKIKNFTICFFLNILSMVGTWATLVFGNLYWTSLGGMSLQNAGFLISLIGVIGILYSIIIPRLADMFGRKKATALCFILMVLGCLVMYAQLGKISAVIFVIGMAPMAIVSHLVIGIINVESVPRRLATTGTAFLQGIGEIFGAAILIRILGSVADAFGLPMVFGFTAITMIIGVILSLVLIETNPRTVKNDNSVSAR